MTLYANTPVHVVSTGGGVVKIIVPANTATQANGGTSIPCRSLYLTRNGGAANVHWAINTSTNVSLGAVINSEIDAPDIAIDDVSKIWVFSTAVASVGITYRY